MSWTATLTITACDSPGTPLVSVEAFDGAQTLHTDAQGRVTLSFDDALAMVIVKLSLLGYIGKNRALNRPAGGGVLQASECLNPSPTGTGDPNEPTGAGGNGGCFILTAVEGTVESPAIAELRTLRDQVAAVAPLAGRLIEEIYREYAHFSPALAARLRDDGDLKLALSARAVRPLLAWYRLAGVLAFRPRDAGLAARGAEQIRKAVEESRAHERSWRPPPGCKPAIELPDARGLSLANWAIIEPLRLMMSDGEASPEERIAAWLAEAPIERISHASEPALLLEELGDLRRLFDFAPTAAATLGRRLAAAWPDRADVVAQAGFAPGAADPEPPAVDLRTVP